MIRGIYVTREILFEASIFDLWPSHPMVLLCLILLIFQRPRNYLCKEAWIILPEGKEQVQMDPFDYPLDVLLLPNFGCHQSHKLVCKRAVHREAALGIIRQSLFAVILFLQDPIISYPKESEALAHHLRAAMTLSTPVTFPFRQTICGIASVLQSLNAGKGSFEEMERMQKL